MKNKIKLSNIIISYDGDCFRITSKDPKLRGKPFRITLPVREGQESFTTDSLIEVFREEQLLQGDSSSFLKGINGDIPKSAKRPSEGAALQFYKLLWMSHNRAIIESDRKAAKAIEKDPAIDLISPASLPLVGRSFGGDLVFLNLATPGLPGREANTIIEGRPGAGKTTLLDNILETVDQFPEEAKGFRLSPRASDFLVNRKTGATVYKQFNNVENFGGALKCYDALSMVERVMWERYRLIERSFKNATEKRDLFQGRRIYLVIDNLEELMETECEELRDGIVSKLRQLLEHGRTTHINLFLGCRDASQLTRLSKPLGEPRILSELRQARRILMGTFERTRAETLLVKPDIPQKLLESPGRGLIITQDEEPIVFQSFEPAV